MADTTDTARAATEHKVALSRLFDAPRERVFAAWTEPERMARWWGARGYTIPVSEAELRPGGSFRYCMRAANGHEHWVRGTIDEYDPPLRYTTTSLVEHDTPGLSGFEVVTIATFTEEAGRTRVTIDTRARSIGDAPVPPYEAMEMGWSQSLDKLEEDLAGRGAARPTAQPAAAAAAGARSAVHDSFRIERRIPAPPGRVYA